MVILDAGKRSCRNASQCRGLSEVPGTFWIGQLPLGARVGPTLWRSAVVLFVVLCGLIPPAAGTVAEPSAATPPDVASYTIEARYDPLDHTVVATQTLTYTNRTDTAIPDLVLHLYLNAFRSEETLWMQEAGPEHRGYGFDADAPGWIRIDDSRLADGTPLSFLAVDADETLVRAELPAPVAPGSALVVELVFTAQLPRVFARTGWADDGDFVMAGQWFEFYADFGGYTVSLTLPEGWVVGTTGTAAGGPQPQGDGAVTQRFAAAHVIDFAWAASPHFRVRTKTVDGIRVEVLAYPESRAAARRAMQATVSGLGLYGDWYGPYGGGLYPELTVILTPEDAGGAGGMEYPTLFTVGAISSQFAPTCLRMLEAETVHELAHQWFQSVIATNEAEAPWLDEGFADYSTSRAFDALYGGVLSTCGGWSLSYLSTRRLEYVMTPETPMTGLAWDLGDGYVIATYSKPVLALTTLERRVGDVAMREFLGEYAGRYAFAHPAEADLHAVMADTLGVEIATWFFESFVEGKETVDLQVVNAASGALAAIREGSLCVPVKVQAVEDGDVVESEWSCDASLDANLEETSSVVIDPGQDSLLDLNLANNGLRRTPDRAAWLGFAVRAVRVLQMLFGVGG
ncbi:MAG: M1 family metallopeptidase [Anaerolineae bacterium]|nr:M1 family metallopeptidase [Anaerolineae bacterium]